LETLPLVSIITPSLNSARFLEEAIQSVIAQDYPRVEYLIMDGGSTDGTLDILRAHAQQLRYVSAADSGAAEAINKGLAGARGEIVAWLNADDTYLPGAVSKAVEALAANPDAGMVYGEGYWLDAEGKVLGSYPTEECDRESLGRECCICQPSCFMRREAVRSVGGLNPQLRASFDYDLWIRMAQRYRFARIPEHLATSRMHAANKTLGQRETVFRESMELLARHYGYVPVRWVYGQLMFLRDGRDQFFEPLRRSAWTYLWALAAGLRRNRGHRWRYVKEWLAPVRPGKLRQVVGQEGRSPGRT